MNGSRGGGEMGWPGRGAESAKRRGAIRAKVRRPKAEVRRPKSEVRRLKVVAEQVHWARRSPGAAGAVLGVGEGALAHGQAPFAVEPVGVEKPAGLFRGERHF